MNGKSTPLNQLPYGTQYTQVGGVGVSGQQPPQQPPQHQQQLPLQQQMPAGMAYAGSLPPMQPSQQQQVQQLPMQQLAPQPQLPMQQLAPPPQVAPPPQQDVLDDDNTVNDVLKQINGSFQQQQPAVYDTQPGQLMGPSGEYAMGAAPVAAAAGPDPVAAPATLLPSPSSSWPELLRVAAIVALLYIAVSFLPLDRMIERFAPSLADLSHASTSLKAAAIAALFILAMKLPLL